MKMVSKQKNVSPCPLPSHSSPCAPLPHFAYSVGNFTNHPSSKPVRLTSPSPGTIVPPSLASLTISLITIFYHFWTPNILIHFLLFTIPWITKMLYNSSVLAFFFL